MRADLTFMGACVATYIIINFTYIIINFAIGVVSGFRAGAEGHAHPGLQHTADFLHAEFPNALAAVACLGLTAFAAWQGFSVSAVLLACAYTTFAVRSYARLHKEDHES